MITAERLRQLLVYDPATGIFRRDGKPVGKPDPQGYIVIRLEGRNYLGHRLAWYWMTGEWPSRGVSFRDHDKANLRWDNLRLASKKQTAQSRKVTVRNKLGIKGVRMTPCGNYRTQIYVDKRTIYLGTYATPEAAHDTYTKAATLHFGEFARP